MSSPDNSYRLDRTAFKIMNFEEADNYMRDYKKYTWQQRLSISLYLTSIAYKFNLHDPLHLDKNFFRIIKRS
jgi:hypothetical protein